MRIKTQLPLPSALFEQLGVTGDRQGYAPDLLESVQPVYQINNPNVTNNVTQFGDAWTVAGNAFIGRFNVPGVAANFSCARLSNPSGSGMDLMVDAIKLSSTLAAETQLKFGVTTAGFAAADWVSGSKDLTPGAATVAVLEANQAGGYNGTQFMGVQAGDSVIHVFNPPLRIAPGGSLSIIDSTANETLYGSVEFRQTAHL